MHVDKKENQYENLFGSKIFTTFIKNYIYVYEYIYVLL